MQFLALYLVIFLPKAIADTNATKYGEYKGNLDFAQFLALDNSTKMSKYRQGAKPYEH